jgi:hypothetical protein
MRLEREIPADRREERVSSKVFIVFYSVESSTVFIIVTGSSLYREFLTDIE